MDKQPDLGISNYFDRGLWSPAETFHEHSKIRRTPDGNVFVAYESRISDAKLFHAMSRPYRTYRTRPQIALPREIASLPGSLDQILRQRQSVREYSGEPITLSDLAVMLGLSYGISRDIPLGENLVQKLRPAPSAGGLFPIELYLAVQHVSGIDPGIYHYLPREHALECLDDASPVEAIRKGVLYPEIMQGAAVLIIFAALFQRSRFKYGERGYRFVHLDAGHIAQNLCLVATALDLGAVPMGGFVDNDLNRLLDLNGVDEAVVYTVAAGQPLRTISPAN